MMDPFNNSIEIEKLRRDLLTRCSRLEVYRLAEGSHLRCIRRARISVTTTQRRHADPIRLNGAPAPLSASESVG